MPAKGNSRADVRHAEAVQQANLTLGCLSELRNEYERTRWYQSRRRRELVAEMQWKTMLLLGALVDWSQR